MAKYFLWFTTFVTILWFILLIIFHEEFGSENVLLVIPWRFTNFSGNLVYWLELPPKSFPSAYQTLVVEIKWSNQPRNQWWSIPLLILCCVKVWFVLFMFFFFLSFNVIFLLSKVLFFSHILRNVLFLLKKNVKQCPRNIS
jgi:hypothetical protein